MGHKRVINEKNEKVNVYEMEAEINSKKIKVYKTVQGVDRVEEGKSLNPFAASESFQKGLKI